MMRLAPSGDVLGRIAPLLKGYDRPDVATVYALQDAAEAWKDMAANQSTRKSHGKNVLRVNWHSLEYSSMTMKPQMIHVKH